MAIDLNLRAEWTIQIAITKLIQLTKEITLTMEKVKEDYPDVSSDVFVDLSVKTGTCNVFLNWMFQDAKKREGEKMILNDNIDLIVEDVMSQLIEARKDDQTSIYNIDFLVQEVIDKLKIESQLKGRIYDTK